jgi:hypothetical protein
VEEILNSTVHEKGSFHAPTTLAPRKEQQIPLEKERGYLRNPDWLEHSVTNSRIFVSQFVQYQSYG